MILSSTNSLDPLDISIDYKHLDISTSLKLYGKHSYNYGEDLLTNLIRLTDHFNSEYAPDNPILGQLWFDNKNKVLNVYKKNGWDAIKPIINTDDLNVIYKEELPEHSHGKLVLKNILPNYIPYTGNHNNVEIYSNKLIFENIKEAVTKKYVDDSLAFKGIYLSKDSESETMSGPFRTGKVSKSDSDYIVANVGYIKDLGKVENSSKYLTTKKHPDFEFTKICSYSITDKKINGKKIFEDNFVTVFFTIRMENKTYEINLPFSYTLGKNAGNERLAFSVVANSINENVRLSIKIIDGANIVIDKLNHTDVLDVQGMIFGFSDNAEMFANSISASAISKNIYSNDIRIDSLLMNDYLNWNYIEPFDNVLKYSFDIKDWSDTNIIGTRGPLSAFNSVQINATKEILQHASDITGIKFEEVSEGVKAHMRFANVDIVEKEKLTNGFVAGRCSSYALKPKIKNGKIVEYIGNSFVYIDNVEGMSIDNLNPIKGSNAYWVLIHEIGHSLGLRHPFESPHTLLKPDDDVKNTVMSYSKADPSTPYPSEFQEYDKLALNYIYGGDGLRGLGTYAK